MGKPTTDFKPTDPSVTKSITQRSPTELKLHTRFSFFQTLCFFSSHRFLCRIVFIRTFALLKSHIQ